VKLSRESSRSLRDAIYDGFKTWDELEILCADCHRPLADITPPTTLPNAIHRLIEDCAARDTLEAFITCMQQSNPGNRLVVALDFTQLTEALSDDEVVEQGGGSTQFKQRLIETLVQLDQPGLHALAAEELVELLATASDREAKTLYLAVLGNVRVERPQPVMAALVAVMGKAMARLVGEGGRPPDLELDLDRTHLPRIDLGGLDLHEADIAFADLRHANLDDVNLTRARGYAVDISGAGFNSANLEEARLHFAVAVRARFHNARMISTFFKGASLNVAEFQQARLQGAHFEQADLTGAKFAQANVSDAYFTGAKLDGEAIASLSRAVGWESAHFDAGVREAIESQR